MRMYGHLAKSIFRDATMVCLENDLATFDNTCQNCGKTLPGDFLAKKIIILSIAMFLFAWRENICFG